MTSTRARFDALELTVFSQGVAMLAEEMGGLLERSSISPNIRERRDASCALFDADGRMVAQAAPWTAVASFSSWAGAMR